MVTVQIFEPAMCCSTGICGENVGQQLVRFAADLDWLKSQGGRDLRRDEAGAVLQMVTGEGDAPSSSVWCC